MDEAETGLKSLLAVKIFGSDLKTLEQKAEQVKDILSRVRGITHVVIVRELGQPSLTIKPDRAKIARYGLNVSDVNTLIETALGGTAATQVIQGEEQFDLVVRMQEPFRQNESAIKNLLITTPDGQHLPLSQFADIRVENGASMIYREAIRDISEYSSALTDGTWPARWEKRARGWLKASSCQSVTSSIGAESIRTICRRWLR